jgi:hypothetical protein
MTITIAAGRDQVFRNQLIGAGSDGDAQIVRPNIAYQGIASVAVAHLSQ